MSKAELSEEELNFQLKKLFKKFDWQREHENLSNSEKAKLLLDTPIDDFSDFELEVHRELLDFYLMMTDFEERGIDICE